MWWLCNKMCGKWQTLETVPVPPQYTLSFMNVIANNEKNLKQIHIYTILIQGISKIFIVQMGTHLFKKKNAFCAGL